MEKFTLLNNEYTIKLNFLQTRKILPEKFSIRVNKIFSDETAAQETMQNLILNDEVTLDLMWYYVEPTATFSYDDFLEQLTGKDLDSFRDAFWREVVNFSGPLKKNLLEGAWTEFKKDLKSAQFQNPS